MHFKSIPAQQYSDKAEHLLLIHGWGISSRIWHHCIPLLSQQFNLMLVDLPGFGLSDESESVELEALLIEMADAMPASFSVLGFSLGGMLAVQLAQKFPSRVKKVVTIASNVVFVAKPEWPSAIAQQTYQQFYQMAEQSPAIALKRFLSLQVKGSAEEKSVLKRVRELADECAPLNTALLSGLDLLTSIDNRQSIQKIEQPLLCVFGKNDQLVPEAAIEKFRQLSLDVMVVNDASHVPHVSHSAQVCKRLNSFFQSDERVETCPKKLNKIKVAQSFGRAATTYDDVAGLQRDVGAQLKLMLPETDRFDRVMDLGCGTGYFLPQLEKQLKPKQLIALDLAEGMLKFSRSHRELQNALWICADAENIPLADNSVDVIFSSLAIQWCENVDDLFSEIYRVLKPGGKFVFSTLGPNTLCELAQAWQAVDNYVHVNQFLSVDIVQGAIKQSGLNIQTWQEQSIVLQYQKLTELTRELKGLGAHNVNAGRPEGLMGKQRIKAFRSAYETQRDGQGKLPASYQLWYAVVEKPINAMVDTVMVDEIRAEG